MKRRKKTTRKKRNIVLLQIEMKTIKQEYGLVIMVISKRERK